jgi:hypothetical protein
MRRAGRGSLGGYFIAIFGYFIATQINGRSSKKWTKVSRKRTVRRRKAAKALGVSKDTVRRDVAQNAPENGAKRATKAAATRTASANARECRRTARALREQFSSIVSRLFAEILSDKWYEYV